MNDETLSNVIDRLEELRQQLIEQDHRQHAEGVGLAIAALEELFPDEGGSDFGENVLELTPSPSPWDLNALWRAYLAHCRKKAREKYKKRLEDEREREQWLKIKEILQMESVQKLRIIIEESQYLLEDEGHEPDLKRMDPLAVFEFAQRLSTPLSTPQQCYDLRAKLQQPPEPPAPPQSHERDNTSRPGM